MTGLGGAAAREEALRQAELHETSLGHIYRITADVRSGTRKRRADAGRRRYTLEEGSDTEFAASLVIGGHLDPAEALRTARANGRDDLPSLPVFQKLLRENGLGRKQRLSGRRSYRRWEATHPLQIVQIDCTALKVRWLDTKTRRILKIEGIDKNHPQLDATKHRVWQIMAVDDHSRRYFLKYVTTPRVTSRDMVEFCCELFCEWGIPWEVYTDNGSEFQGFFARAEKILNAIPAIAHSGGYRTSKHLPGNSQASGKVEVAHKWAEKMDKYVGLAQSTGIEVSIDTLNEFAAAICNHHNTALVHRVTGETPMARWFGTRVTLRTLQPEIIRSALLSDEFDAVIAADLTVAHKGSVYQLPNADRAGSRSPFVNFIGRRVHVVVPHSLDSIYVTLPNGEEYDVDKRLARPDAAGEFRSAPETQTEHLKKRLKKVFAEDAREAKQRKRLTGEEFQVPFINHDVPVADGILRFPQPVMEISPAEVNGVTPVPVDAAKETSVLRRRKKAADEFIGRPVGYWESVTEFSSHFGSVAEAKEFLLTVFPSMSGERPIDEVEQLVKGRDAAPRLRAVS